MSLAWINSFAMNSIIVKNSFYGIVRQAAWVSVLSALSFPGCDCFRKSQSPASLPISSQPMLSISRHPEYPQVGGSSVHGLVLAVWPDRRVVRAAGPEAIGRSYIEGWMSDESWQTLTRLLEELLISKDSIAPPVVDAACECMIVHYGISTEEVCTSSPLEKDSIPARMQDLVTSAPLARSRALPTNSPETRPILDQKGRRKGDK